MGGAFALSMKRQDANSRPSPSGEGSKTLHGHFDGRPLSGAGRCADLRTRVTKTHETVRVNEDNSK